MDSQGECQSYDLKSPTSILSLDDQLFRTSRGLAIVAACLGFFTMAGLWMGALRDHVAPSKALRMRTRARWKICVGGGLLLCSMIQGMALFILHSNACVHSTQVHTSRVACRLGDGGWWVVAATAQYLVTGFLVLGWPCASKSYSHASLAPDESEEEQHAYPAEVADDDALWDGFWKGLGSEEVELTDMPTAPYSDHVDPVTDPAGTASRPSPPPAAPSLRDLLLGFDSELVSFEPMNLDHHTVATKPPFVEIPPPPRVVLPPNVSLERLRQQSKIAPRVVTSVNVGEEGDVITRSTQEVELGSRDNLKSILNGNVPSVSEGRTEQRSDRNPRRQQPLSTTSRHVPATARQEPSRNGLNSILDVFDDDTL